MKAKRMPAWFLLLALCLNLWIVPGAAVDGGRRVETLGGKSLCILGDSYCAGYGLAIWEGEAAWPYLMASTWGMDYYDHALSGSTLAEGENSNLPMVQRVYDLPQERLDIIIVQGGSNDWSHNLPLGDADSRDTTTSMGALNTILDTLEAQHPEATLVCFTTWISGGTKNKLGLATTDYGAAMEALCQRRGILCYHAENEEENGIHMTDQDFRTEFCLSPTDPWHLNQKGQKMFASLFGSWLQEQLYGATEPSQRFADLLPGSEELKQAVNQLLKDGIMQGTTDTLFSPTQAAQRSTLAVTLYRMAERPDYDPQNPELEQALGWAASQGILSEAMTEAAERSLSRRELALALYRYETEVQGGEITSISGLDHYQDAGALDAESAVALGWALQAEILSDLDGRLCPQGTVSRGALAKALAKLQS